MDSKQIDVILTLQRWRDFVTWVINFSTLLLQSLGHLLNAEHFMGEWLETLGGLETSQCHVAETEL